MRRTDTAGARRQVRVTVVACLVALWAIGSLSGQTRARRFEPVAAGERASFERTQKVAVLVGVGHYPERSGIGSLLYPPRDVKSLQGVLERQGYTVIPLVDGEATKEAVRGTLRDVKDVLDGKGGTVVFHFSGHGWAPTGRNILATYDAGAGNLDGSGLPVDEVVTLLAQTGAERRVLWLDACRNEPGKSVAGRSFQQFSKAEGTRILFSTRAGRLSYESDQLQQGVFTHFLVKALEGEAAGTDGNVTFRDVTDFVIQQVGQWGLKRGQLQVPYEGGEASGDFLLARTSVPPPPVTSRGPQKGDVRVGKDGLRYVYVPVGTFRMGCSEGDGDCFDHEKPARDVQITRGFWMGQTEVTVDAYKRFVAATGRTMPEEPVFQDRKLNVGWSNGSMPIVMVDWNDARGYCRWAGLRLPTEAEWEYAARGGTTTKTYGSLPEIAWSADNSGKEILNAAKLWDEQATQYMNRLFANANIFHPVGLKLPNGFGLYDMLGNVWEWAEDWFGAKYYEAPDRRDPQGPPNGTDRVLRGGSWEVGTKIVRVSSRNWGSPAYSNNVIGLRCAGE